MLAPLGQFFEWAANTIVSFSILLAGVVHDEAPWVIGGVLLIFAGVVFLIWRALRYVFAGLTVTLS